MAESSGDPLQQTTPITQLLQRAANGESMAAEQVMPIIYERLRELAHRHLMRSPQQRTLATTSLVHEAYLLLFGNDKLSWKDRGHFFAYAAKSMRNILIDRAKAHLTDKRSGKLERMDLDDFDIEVDNECVDLIALDQILTQMAGTFPRLVLVVELRFFVGLSIEDTAKSLAVQTRSVERDWQKARAFIHRALEGHEE